MIDMNYLTFLASRFTSEEIIKQCIEFGKTKDASQARDFHAFSLAGTSIIENALEDVIAVYGKKVTAGIGFEYIEITGAWNKEHHHLKSIGILLCIDVPAGWEGYFEFHGEKSWHPLMPQQIILAPIGSNHGFRKGDMINPTETLKMIGINYPPIQDDDTIEI
jgi:hypothetical protein